MKQEADKLIKELQAIIKKQDAQLDTFAGEYAKLVEKYSLLNTAIRAIISEPLELETIKDMASASLKAANNV